MGNKITAIADLVAKELCAKRAGVLWFYGEGFAMPQIDGFKWINYVSGKSKLSQWPTYRINDVVCPVKEAHTLDLLMMLGACARVLGEVFSGFPVTNEARLLEACIERKIPVIIDTSRMDEWFAQNSPDKLDALNAGKECLKSKGVVFISFKSFAKQEKQDTQEKILKYDNIIALNEDGWLTWSEISDKVKAGCKVKLGNKTKLTPQAIDALGRKNIEILD